VFEANRSYQVVVVVVVVACFLRLLLGMATCMTRNVCAYILVAYCCLLCCDCARLPPRAVGALRAPRQGPLRHPARLAQPRGVDLAYSRSLRGAGSASL
jgi:hypothetical protein